MSLRFKVFFIVFFVVRTLSAQLSIDFILNKDNGESCAFSTNQGRIYFDLVEKNLRIYTDDASGNQVEWVTCNVEDVHSFSFTAHNGEQLLMVATNIYHATQTFLSLEKIEVDRQNDEWIVTLLPENIQSIDVTQLRNLMVENIGSQESGISENSDMNTNDVFVSGNCLFIQSDKPIGAVKVYSCSGQLQLSAYSASSEIEIHHDLPHGTYIVQSNGIRAEKIFL